MTVTDRTAAPAPSPAEQAVIDQFGIFEAEERVVEEVARAMWDTLADDTGPWDAVGSLLQAEYRRLAAAAVAVYRATQDGGAEEAVRRVEALAEVLMDAPGQGPLSAALIYGALAGGDRQKLDEYHRATLAPQAGDGAR